MNNHICAIGVYFGELPHYFPLWVKSAENNKEVDFLIFTDNNIPNLPLNVKNYIISLDWMQKRATEILGFSAVLREPYKCCDYKPLYGLIFAEYVSEYEYWGHMDFDMIFGSIADFIEQYQIDQYDKFLPLGHLSFYRNTEIVNHYYCMPTNGLTRHYKRVYTSSRNFGFDELSGMGYIYRHHNYSFFSNRIYADIDPAFKRFRHTERKVDGKVVNYKLQVFYWEKGHVYRAYLLDGEVYKDEYIYIHFQKRPNYRIEFDPTDIDSFYITSQGFIPKHGEVDEAVIRELNEYPGDFYEKIEWIRFEIRYLLKVYSDAIRWRIRGEREYE